IMLPALANGAAGGLPAFLLFWGVLEAALVVLLLSVLWGREVVEVRHETLTLRHLVFGVGRGRAYAAEYVRDLRASPTIMLPYPGAGLWNNRAGGGLAFDYGAQTITFGGAIHEAEAKQVVAEIVQRFPRYK
ncbi:MAG: hypothetical protein HYZ35_03920, partial [Chloroflexi bacterium]|nr:hypothetical protein [Chloroflexota bacterium]